VKIDRVAQLFSLTHDLTCTVTELVKSARRFVAPPVLEFDQAIFVGLARAAVAFTIQLAIDTTKYEPAVLRELETELMSKLEGAKT
jgi:hypothetical protein